MKTLNFMPHQEQVLEVTAPFNRVAYYLDMGLGKTFVGAEKMWLLNNNINLVICQKSKIDDWVQHFTDYYPEYRVMNLTKKSEGLTFKNAADNFDLYGGQQIIGVINYELAFRRSYIANMQGFTLLLDESSLITNENAKRSKFILRLCPESVILLSGTPTSGKYENLWSQVRLLGWNISKKAFFNSYVITEWIETGTFKREVVIGYKNVEHLKKKLTEHGVVFMKTKDVIELPEQVEQIIKVKKSKEYKYFTEHGYLVTQKLSAAVSGWKTGIEVELVGDNSLTKMLHARQLCGQYSIEKLEAFEDLIFSTDDRLIVFYNFNEELEVLHQIALKKTPNISVLNGNRKDLQAYNLYSDSITFIQYQAGAMGGNFQLSNKVIYFTLPLGKGSCDIWEQSKKRIHRIGQDKTCFYYYLMVKGSIEEHNLKMLRLGKELTDELFKES